MERKHNITQSFVAVVRVLWKKRIYLAKILISAKLFYSNLLLPIFARRYQFLHCVGIWLFINTSFGWINDHPGKAFFVGYIFILGNIAL